MKSKIIFSLLFSLHFCNAMQDKVTLTFNTSPLSICKGIESEATTAEPYQINARSFLILLQETDRQTRNKKIAQESFNELLSEMKNTIEKKIIAADPISLEYPNSTVITLSPVNFSSRMCPYIKKFGKEIIAFGGVPQPFQHMRAIVGDDGIQQQVSQGILINETTPVLLNVTTEEFDTDPRFNNKSITLKDYTDETKEVSSFDIRYLHSLATDILARWEERNK